MKCGVIPVYIQAIGKELLRENRITAETVEILFNKFIEEEVTVIFRQELNRLGSVEKQIILKMAREDLTRINEILTNQNLFAILFMKTNKYATQLYISKIFSKNKKHKKSKKSKLNKTEKN